MRRTILLVATIVLEKTYSPMAWLALVVALAVGLLAPVGTIKPAEAAFPGENGRIAFDVGDPGQNRDVYVMDADGSNQTNLTSSSIYDSNPSFSPDGTKIAFQSLRDGNLEIYVMDADGSNSIRLTNNQTADSWPAWSPDGTKIVFGRNDDVYVMNADGSNQTNLTKSTDVLDYTPTWSPNGTKIAFESGWPNSEIYAMNPDGSQPTNLTNNSATDQAPDWSPDGTKIAFQSARSDDLFTTLYTMNADGSNQTRLFNNQTHAGADLSPAWSSDGTKIAYEFYSTDDIVGREVYVVNSDGSSPTNLTKNSLQEESPDWGVKPPPDTTPPTVVNTKPAARDTGVLKRTNVVAAFSEKMARSTLNSTTFKLFKVNSDDSTTQITNVTVSSSTDGLKATLNPFGRSSTLLRANTKYKAIVTTQAKDLVGNQLDQSPTAGKQQKVWTFKTGG